MQLEAYPATVNLSEVSDYPHIVGNSQFFYRMQYLWGLQGLRSFVRDVREGALWVNRKMMCSRMLSPHGGQGR